MSYETVTEWKSRSLSVKEAESGSLQCAGKRWCDSIVFDSIEDVCSTIPCCIKEPTPNQKLLSRVKLFSTTSDPGLQGWASYHSYGLNLGSRQEIAMLFLNLCRLWNLKQNSLSFFKAFLTNIRKNWIIMVLELFGDLQLHSLFKIAKLLLGALHSSRAVVLI